MDIKEAVIKRHSVRRYLDKSIEEDVAIGLKAIIDEYVSIFGVFPEESG